jgi:hypothetical protein
MLSVLRRDTKIVYRSTFRLLISTPGGVFCAVAGVGAGLTGEPYALVLVPFGVYLVMFAIWPRLVVDAHGLAVRNVRSRTVPWSEVKAARVESQLPLLGRAWHWMDSHSGASFGARGYPGLVLHTSAGAVPVMAVQRHPLRHAGFADRVAVQLTTARRAAHVGHDPVQAARHAHTKTEAATTQ